MTKSITVGSLVRSLDASSNYTSTDHRILKATGLVESMQLNESPAGFLWSYDYEVPSDKLKQMMDFYMLSIFPWEVNAMPSEDYATPFFNDDDQRAATDAVQRTREKLLPALKKEMLRAVFFAISSEVKHVFVANSINQIESDIKYGYLDLSPNTVRILKNLEKLQHAEGGSSYYDKKEFSGEDKKRQERVKRLLAASEGNRLEAVKAAYQMFDRLSWRSQYGGRPWAMIAKGWLSLYNANTLRDMQVWIDHIYDLQHNTNTVFDKCKTYYGYGGGSGFSWLKRALDWKLNVRSLYEYAGKCSADLYRLAAVVMRMQYGTTQEGWLRQAAMLAKNKKNVKDFFSDPSKIQLRNTTTKGFAAFHKNIDKTISIVGTGKTKKEAMDNASDNLLKADINGKFATLRGAVSSLSSEDIDGNPIIYIAPATSDVLSAVSSSVVKYNSAKIQYDRDSNYVRFSPGFIPPKPITKMLKPDIDLPKDIDDDAWLSVLLPSGRLDDVIVIGMGLDERSARQSGLNNLIDDKNELIKTYFLGRESLSFVTSPGRSIFVVQVKKDIAKKLANGEIKTHDQSMEIQFTEGKQFGEYTYRKDTPEYSIYASNADNNTRKTVAKKLKRNISFCPITGDGYIAFLLPNKTTNDVYVVGIGATMDGPVSSSICADANLKHKMPHNVFNKRSWNELKDNADKIVWHVEADKGIIQLFLKGELRYDIDRRIAAIIDKDGKGRIGRLQVETANQEQKGDNQSTTDSLIKPDPTFYGTGDKPGHVAFMCCPPGDLSSIVVVGSGDRNMGHESAYSSALLNAVIPSDNILKHYDLTKKTWGLFGAKKDGDVHQTVWYCKAGPEIIKAIVNGKIPIKFPKVEIKLPDTEEEIATIKFLEPYPVAAPVDKKPDIISAGNLVGFLSYGSWDNIAIICSGNTKEEIFAASRKYFGISSISVVEVQKGSDPAEAKGGSWARVWMAKIDQDVAKKVFSGDMPKDDPGLFLDPDTLTVTYAKSKTPENTTDDKEKFIQGMLKQDPKNNLSAVSSTKAWVALIFPSGFGGEFMVVGTGNDSHAASQNAKNNVNRVFSGVIYDSDTNKIHHLIMNHLASHNAAQKRYVVWYVMADKSIVNDIVSGALPIRIRRRELVIKMPDYDNGQHGPASLVVNKPKNIITTATQDARDYDYSTQTNSWVLFKWDKQKRAPVIYALPQNYNDALRIASKKGMDVKFPVVSMIEQENLLYICKATALARANGVGWYGNLVHFPPDATSAGSRFLIVAPSQLVNVLKLYPKAMKIV